jgi:glycosyltransferase involved in cell wall biosynthesis
MKQRIAVVTTSYPSTDDDVSGHFVRSEVTRLANAGHHVTVLCPGEPDRYDDGTHPNIVTRRLGAARLFGWPGALHKFKRRPWVLIQLPPFVRRCRTALHDGAFDRVIAHWLLGSGWPVALAGSAPTEVVVHGSDARLLANFAPLRRYVLGALRDRGCTLRLVGSHLAPLLRTGHNDEWIDAAVVSPLPVSLPPLPSREQLRTERGLRPETFVAVLVGRLISSKRTAVALRHAPLPSGALRVVIGSGPLQASLAAEFPDVHFTGQLPRGATLGWVKAADVVVSASLNEGAPTSLREARLLNVPVWTAEYGSAALWAARDPGVSVLSFR